MKLAMIKMTVAIAVAVGSGAIPLWGATSAGVTAQAEIVKVKGRGVGSNKVEALKDAYRDAVERAVGFYVDAEQMMKNEEMVKDQILTQSNAYIEKYDVVKEDTRANGLVELHILAEVRKTVLEKKLSDVMPSKEYALDAGLESTHAKLVTKEKRNVDGAALLAKALEGFDPLLLSIDCSLASKEAVVGNLDSYSGRRRELSSEVTHVNYLFKQEINEQRFFENVAQPLKQVLDQIAIEEPKKITLAKGQVKAVRNPYTDFPGTEKMLADALSYVEKQTGGMFSIEKVDSIALSPSGQLNLPGKSFFIVVSVNKYKTVYEGYLYKLDEGVSKILDSWRFKFDMKLRDNHPAFKVTFLDGEGECIYTENIPKKSMGMNFCWSIVHSEVGLISIGPWVWSSRGASIARYFWQGFDLPRDVLPDVKNMTIELVQ